MWGVLFQVGVKGLLGGKGGQYGQSVIDLIHINCMSFVSVRI